MDWDWSYDDLESIGVKVSPAQIEVVEGGGKVLAFEPLPAPEAMSCQCGGSEHEPHYDAAGNKVMVPYLFDAYGPNHPMPKPWRSCNMVEEWEQMNADEWREFPSVVGAKDLYVTPDNGCSGKRVEMHRVWEFLPLVTPAQESMARELMLAAGNQLRRAMYEEIQAWYLMNEDLIEGYLDMDEIMAQDLQDGEYWQLRDSLRTAGYIKDDPTREDPLGWVQVMELQVAPIETYLYADPETLQMWRDLLYKSRRDFHCVANSFPAKNRRSDILYHIGSDPWF